MSFLVLRAYWTLVRFDVYLAKGEFHVLYDKVRGCRVGRKVSDRDAVEQICSAVDLACIWYWKQVLCLQRSAATACLLRHYGIEASMVIGAQSSPFKAHAWVEVDGRIVNDKSYLRERYSVLDRC